MIEEMTSDTIMQAERIYSESWQSSHKDICSAEFLALHTPEYKRNCLEAEIAKGCRVYMLTERGPVGIVSIHDSLIETLYVLPREQRKGYGTRLLNFAVDHCTCDPTLWVLNTNEGARRLYERSGFRATGNIVKHTDVLWESELCFIRNRTVIPSSPSSAKTPSPRRPGKSGPMLPPSGP